ncbi:Asp23/Gls24 family envelope stress response protein [Corynebacterium sp.]|uniref:Asp23/Gls24 family envelope stress response protein n=1 Tax=Corynebacterium sp. TaxID=1720 RepID=UPI003B3BCCCF
MATSETTTGTTTADTTGTAATEELPRSEAYRQQRTHTSIELKVLEKIATRAALTVPGVIRHSSGIGQFTGRRLPRINVQMAPSGHAAVAEVQIATRWPAPTVAVAQVTRETVGEWIEHMTGVPVLAVNVDVAAVVPNADGAASISVDDLIAAARTPELTRVTATPLHATSPTTDRMVTDVVVPSAPAPVQPVHPRPVESVRLRPVSASEPRPAQHVHAPEPRPVLHPSAPTPVHARRVPTPVPPTVHRPRSPFSAAQPRLLEPVTVSHVEVTTPPPAHGLPVLYDIPTPTGPRMRDIPTPRGLPTRAVPTPQGLEVTIFPTARRRRRIPVTVDTSRRWPARPSDDDHDRSPR